MIGNISAATDKGRSVVGRLQSKINSLPTNVDGPSTTLGEISSAVNDVSTVIETLSAKMGSTSVAVDSLSAKTDSISNTIGRLSETMGEIVKREQMAMEKFSNLSSRTGWPIPVVFGPWWCGLLCMHSLISFDFLHLSLNWIICLFTPNLSISGGNVGTRKCHCPNIRDIYSEDEWHHKPLIESYA